jgi:hypothetical protein
MNLFEGVEIIEPPLNLTERIMAEVMQIELATEAQKEELSLARNVKGIVLLVVLASINAALFGSWLFSLMNLQFDTVQLQLMYRILAEAFTYCEIVGRHTGSALQTVVTSIAGALPWEWIGVYVGFFICVMAGTWFIHRKGGDEA